MLRAAWQRFLAEPNHRLIGVFLVFILLPGVVLGFFALRSLRQEDRLAQQQIQERLERFATLISRDLDLQFTQWQKALETTAMEAMAESRSWPDIVREAIKTPGSGVIVWLEGKALRAYPSNQLLYPLENTSPPINPQEPFPPSFVQAEYLELSQKNFPRAIGLYQSLLTSADAKLQPFLLHRLARSYRKAGRLDDAVGIYQKLAALTPVNIGKLPSDFLARAEICSIRVEQKDSTVSAMIALALYKDLVSGKWSLDRARYLYYSDQFRSWINNDATAAKQSKPIKQLEEQKLALTGALEELLEDPKRLLSTNAVSHISFWQTDPLRAIVLSGDFLNTRLWPAVLSPAKEDDLNAVLYSPEGEEVFGSPPQDTTSLSFSHTFRSAGTPFSLTVWPREPDTLYADLKHRQSLYMGIMIFVVALLVFGSYFTARTIRRELELARMRADFVSTVSHEFRSPLTGIRQLAEMLFRGRAAGEERKRRYYKMILQESERLGRLVENLLDFSRMEEGRKQYRLAPLDTSAWLRELVSDFQSEVDESGISIAADIPADLPAISADGEALECAVHNLLDNAVKYSLGSQTVRLEAGAANGNVTISVSDRGVGIAESERKHIFDKFYRVDGEISLKVKGAGLGLSLVKHIVAAHGGTIDCESQAGKGSKFSIHIPAVPNPQGG